MSKARLVITAVTAEGLSQGAAARRCGVCQGWVSRLLARCRQEGEVASEPRSCRPLTSPDAISSETVQLIVTVRKDLAGRGLDAGPGTICWHLEHRHKVRVSAWPALALVGSFELLMLLVRTHQRAGFDGADAIPASQFALSADQTEPSAASAVISLEQMVRTWHAEGRSQ